LTNRIVIDTDPGVDDAHALMMAFAHRRHGTRIEAVTTVAGNVGLDRTTPNACTILDQLGVAPDETPIFAGCPHSLVGPDVRTLFHGADGLGDCNFPPSARRVEGEHAALALIRLADRFPGEITLVAIGPLTNLALATRLDPNLPGKFKRLVVMGGSIHGAGNMPNSSEYNFFVDPEAAAVVFECWPGLWLLAWETAVKYRLSAEQLAELARPDTPQARFFSRIALGMVKTLAEIIGEPCLHAPDGLAMAVALEPDIVTRFESRPAVVEIGGGHARGHSIVDWYNRDGRAPNVNLVLELDFDRFWTLLTEAVA
jgi:purine nucleosidase